MMKPFFSRRTILVLAVVVCVVSVITFMLTASHSSLFVRSTSTDSVTVTQSSFSLPRSAPTVLRVPKLRLEVPFEEPLGLQATGEIEAPQGYETVAYYKHAPTPGEIGPAVVLGHVDSVAGPAVFFSLGRLNKGDTFDVERADGTIATFAVMKIDRQLQSEFPTEEVYGDIPYAGIRLITCSGQYDRGEFRYTHNLIVYGELVATSSVSVNQE